MNLRHTPQAPHCTPTPHVTTQHTKTQKRTSQTHSQHTHTPTTHQHTHTPTDTHNTPHHTNNTPTTHQQHNDISHLHLLPLSELTSCAFMIKALMHQNGSSHTEKGHLLHIVKCPSWWRSQIRSPLKLGCLSCTRSKSLTRNVVQMNLDTCESAIAMKQNHDILFFEMMKQMVEVTKTISKRRSLWCTQE